MDAIQRAKDILDRIAADIPSLEELTPDNGDETIRKTPYLLTLADIRDLLALVESPTLVMEPVDPDRGDLMTIADFAESVKMRCLIDYDGFGHWATATHVSNISVWPSLYQDWPNPPKAEPPITHVMWYNR